MKKQYWLYNLKEEEYISVHSCLESAIYYAEKDYLNFYTDHDDIILDPNWEDYFRIDDIKIYDLDETCFNCEGKGEVEVLENTPDFASCWEKCPVCKGKGFITVGESND